jgi:pimeloyl-ACP methyl ester carboxylesterase
VLQRFFSRLQLKRLVTISGEIVYLEGGSGPTLLLIHGFGDNKDSWAKLAGYLTKHYHVIVIDVPGFGDSYHPKADYTVVKQVERINEFVEVKELSLFTLVGNSYGGYLSTIYAGMFPKLVSALLLISPLGVQQSEQSAVFKDIASGQRPKLLPITVDDFRHLIRLCFNKQPYIPQFVLRHLSYSAKENALVRESIFYVTHRVKDDQIQFDIPIESILKSITIPTSVIWGECDNILSYTGVGVIESLKNLVVVTETFEGVGHLPQLECPEKLASYLINFLSIVD